MPLDPRAGAAAFRFPAAAGLSLPVAGQQFVAYVFELATDH